jgi:predicted Rossmann fold flavoprotein
MEFDICIVGAGPAGLTAGIFSAESGAKTVIAESNTVAGRKLLRTGRGRCNLTHTGTIDDFVKAYGRYGRFLKHSLYEFSPEDVRGFFAEHNLVTKEEKDGCVFPVTDRATDVARVLVDRARRLEITFLYDKKVESIKKRRDGFRVQAAGETINCKAVIIATGGMSWSFTGSTGDGYGFANELGHHIVDVTGALVRLVTKEDWPSKLRGVGVERVSITALVGESKIKVTGSMMFTDDGIGGPAVFDLSRDLCDHLSDSQEPVQIFIDLQPGADAEELRKCIIDKCARSPKKELAGVLTEILPRALAIDLCEKLEPSINILAGQLSKDKRTELIKLIKYLPLTVVSLRPLKEATVTRGGVSTEGIDSKTMESKLCKGLYFAGEVMDADGPCGGYNLQIAWSTGALAGRSAAKYVSGK